MAAQVYWQGDGKGQEMLKYEGVWVIWYYWMGLLPLDFKAVIYVKLNGTDKSKEQTLMLKEGAKFV